MLPEPPPDALRVLAAWESRLSDSDSRSARRRHRRSGQHLREPDAVADATAAELAMLLTAIVRSERVSEGSLEGAFESGLLRAVARRAGVLTRGGPSS